MITNEQLDAIGSGLPFFIPRDEVLALTFINGALAVFGHLEGYGSEGMALHRALMAARQRAMHIIDQNRREAGLIP